MKAKIKRYLFYVFVVIVIVGLGILTYLFKQYNEFVGAAQMLLINCIFAWWAGYKISCMNSRKIE